MPGAERGPATAPVRAALQDYRARLPAALGAGVLLALLLLPLDLGRQLLVRDDPSLVHALLVDVVGVLLATAGQLALVGALTGSRPGRWLADGTARTLAAVRRHPRAVLLGLVGAGVVSGLLTLPVSVAALGADQVLGPLEDPPLAALVVASLSDALGTAVTAPFFALLVGRLTGRGADRSTAAAARARP